jgi:hypothetical protein
MDFLAWPDISLPSSIADLTKQGVQAISQIGDRIQQAWLVDIQPTCVLLDRGGQGRRSVSPTVSRWRPPGSAGRRCNRPRREHQTTRTHIRVRVTDGSDNQAMLPKLSPADVVEEMLARDAERKRQQSSTHKQ